MIGKRNIVFAEQRGRWGTSNVGSLNQQGKAKEEKALRCTSAFIIRDYNVGNTADTPQGEADKAQTKPNELKEIEVYAQAFKSLLAGICQKPESLVLFEPL